MDLTKPFKLSRTLRALLVAVLMMVAEIIGLDYQLIAFDKLASDGLSLAEIGQIVATLAGGYFRFIANEKLV